MIECSTAAACEQIAVAQTQFITDTVPATMLVALVLVSMYAASDTVEGDSE